MGSPDVPGRGDGCPASGRDQQEAVLAAGLPQGAPPPGSRVGDTGVGGFLAQTRVGACQGAAHALSRTMGGSRVTAAARASGCSRTPWQGRGARGLAFLPLRARTPGMGGPCSPSGRLPTQQGAEETLGGPPLHVREAPAGPPSSCLCGKHLPGPAEDRAWGLSRTRLPQQGQMPVFPAEQRRGLWLGPPCPGPGASIGLCLCPAHGKVCLLTAPLQAAPRNKLPPEGSPGRRSPGALDPCHSRLPIPGGPLGSA